ncbi:MAG: hypothetical protein LBC17_02535 [Lactobacillaceae bacterium]|jgi:hypothetical protein|nr:hypothetical protein [Lactobacillaceae bacterium]
MYLVLAAIFSYGVFLIFVEQLAKYQPRYAYGFAIFMVITIILLLDNISINTKTIFKMPTQIITVFLSYYILIFPFVYASSLNANKIAFQTQSIILVQELKDQIDNTTNDIYLNTLFKNSPVFNNSVANYPILSLLVPNNESLYWPNLLLFNTLNNGMPQNIKGFDPKVIPLNMENLKVDDFYYQIYKQDNNLYVIRK